MTDDDHPANARRVQLRTAISTPTHSGLGRATSEGRGTQTRLRTRLNPRQLRQHYSSFKSEPLCGCSRWRTIQPPLQYTEKPDQSDPRNPVQLLPARQDNRRLGRRTTTTSTGSGILHITSKGHNNPVPDSIPTAGFQLINKNSFMNEGRGLRGLHRRYNLFFNYNFTARRTEFNFYSTKNLQN